jgi:transposase
MHIYLPRWSIFNILIICVRVTLIRWFRSMLFKLDFHQVHEFSIHHFLIFIKFSRSRSKWSFLKFFILTKNFLVCQRVYVKSKSKRDRFLMFCSNRLIFIKFTNSRFIIFWFSSSSQALDSDATFWNLSYWRKIFLVCQRVYVKSTSRRDREYYREECLNQIRSDQINMFSSLSDTLRETITLRFVRDDFNKVIVAATEVSIRQMQKMKSNWTHFEEIMLLVLTIEHRPRKLSHFHEMKLLKFLKQRSHAYLNEMCWFLWDEFEIFVNESTVNKTLKRLEWNKKKMMRQVAQRNQSLRNDWMQRLSEWIAEQLIFLNESAACERTDDRRYDWASTDIALTMSQNLRRFKRWSILSAFIVNDYIAWEVHQSSITAVIFNDFVQNQMLSQCTSTIDEDLRWVFD